MRPNIRVEIQNNLAEAMEVDENEEGELTDGDDKAPTDKQLFVETNTTRSQPLKSSFTTGIDILDKKEQEKLQERAKRFCLTPGEIKNFTDEDFQLLHSSLGITMSNEANVRFEVIHIRGIELMNAGDLLDYFLDYAPVSVEWIDEESCNVVWLDKVSAARALHFISKPVRGMPVRDDSSYFDNLQEVEETDQSILILNKNREIQLQEDDSTSNKLLNESNSVDISEITSTIPPGYWRLGNKHPKAKCLLLRFSLKTDKKHFKMEQFSRYYKMQGKSNVKAAVPVLAKQVTQGIFGRNKDMFKSEPSSDNPWSALAKNWDEDAKFREKERDFKKREETPSVLAKNHSLRVRLGSKRKEESSVEPDEEEEKPKKVKIPRMRMYADEEEEKIKRKQMLKRISSQMKKIEEDTSTNSDLRTVLNMASRTNAGKVERSEPEVFDLGATLKNRNRKMVFQIKREPGERKKPEPEDERDKQHTHRRRHSNSEDEDVGFRSDHYGKTKSKVAVVIKTQKKPAVRSAVASTVWSRMSGKSSESESEDSNSEKSSESETEEIAKLIEPRRVTDRPGFSSNLKQVNHKSPLKIEISNDHFRRN